MSPAQSLFYIIVFAEKIFIAYDKSFHACFRFIECKQTCSFVGLMTG
ncbi:hypothetical protein SAMN05443507_10280 [Alicyclobacillus tolerans]|uniref:Uncharacterized protein n=1 Tax=Alicyclobacillus tolerans TaxID=90970 RepID=A0A1M6L298_9BACL|nr:hypothetical protein SAMN05443507_10280 [Alicyclobacillus montanus]